MNRHFKKYIGFLYCNHHMKSHGVWKTMQLLGLISYKKLTFAIILIKMSLICVRTILTSISSINYLSNMLVKPPSTGFWLDKS